MCDHVKVKGTAITHALPVHTVGILREKKGLGVEREKHWCSFLKVSITCCTLLLPCFGAALPSFHFAATCAAFFPFAASCAALTP
ncbi:hypothetical protein SLEP1_g55628 [Rubroshorea leprosula]|uniref:Uncharacterized protein n=1 Tax=Rubroshorea leprosula TaxID=152421 RepID=A0AAV5MK58_9ROSI|nr:hypothetical protein SLEP1_g55628 [Rubroshorea leprosula]